MNSIAKATATGVVVAISWAAAASAHPATSCIQQVVAAAAKVGVKTDADGTSIIAFHPTSEPLRPLLAQMTTCLARVLPEQTDRPSQNGLDPQHYWYITATQEWCRSTNDIGIMGGNSATKNYQSFFLVCGTTPKR